MKYLTNLYIYDSRRSIDYKLKPILPEFFKFVNRDRIQIEKNSKK